MVNHRHNDDGHNHLRPYPGRLGGAAVHASVRPGRTQQSHGEAGIKLPLVVPPHSGLEFLIDLGEGAPPIHSGSVDEHKPDGREVLSDTIEYAKNDLSRYTRRVKHTEIAKR